MPATFDLHMDTIFFLQIFKHGKNLWQIFTLEKMALSIEFIPLSDEDTEDCEIF